MEYVGHWMTNRCTTLILTSDTFIALIMTLKLAASVSCYIENIWPNKFNNSLNLFSQPKNTSGHEQR